MESARVNTIIQIAADKFEPRLPRVTEAIQKGPEFQQLAQDLLAEAYAPKNASALAQMTEAEVNDEIAEHLKLFAIFAAVQDCHRVEGCTGGA